MARTPYLIDTNVLLRWVKPDDRDYPVVVAAIEAGDAAAKAGCRVPHSSRTLR